MKTRNRVKESVTRVKHKVRIEVDQSGKVEDTAIACTRGDNKPNETITLSQIVNLTMSAEELKNIGGSSRR